MERSYRRGHGGNDEGDSARPPFRSPTSQASSHNQDPNVGTRMIGRDGGNDRRESARTAERSSYTQQYTPLSESRSFPVSPLSGAGRLPQLIPQDVNSKISAFLRKYRIREKIDNAIYNKGIYRKEFVTETDLRRIWIDRLKDFLDVLGTTPVDDDLRYIRGNLLKILSILVAIGWSEWHRFYTVFLESMKDHRRSRLDKSIPFDLDVLEHKSFLGDWGRNFRDNQYMFYPIIVEEGKALEYERWRPVPFILKESKVLGQGSYGVVKRETIAAHQFLLENAERPQTNRKLVAIKSMDAQGDFRKERDNLLMLNSSLSKHEHIVRYLAIIIVGDPGSTKEFNILMPLATMNLENFLHEEPSSLPEFNVKDLLQQTASIADAIKWLHGGLPIRDRRFICCHMDLKLDNVLVYLDRNNKDEPVGKWKIADFGISTLNELETGPKSRERHWSQTLAVESPANTLAYLTARAPATRPPAAYQAPEVSKGSQVGRSSDVWSFGCILFQVLARAVGPGVQKLLELDQLRQLEDDKTTLHPTDYFFRERGPDKYLNPHVKDWLEASWKGHSISFHDRHFVQNCKKLNLKMLRIDPAHRPKASEVNDTLWNILKGPEVVQSPEDQPASMFPPRQNLALPQIFLTPVQAQEVPLHAHQYGSASEFMSATLRGPFEWADVPAIPIVDNQVDPQHPVRRVQNPSAARPNLPTTNPTPQPRFEQDPRRPIVRKPHPAAANPSTLSKQNTQSPNPSLASRPSRRRSSNNAPDLNQPFNQNRGQFIEQNGTSARNSGSQESSSQPSNRKTSITSSLSSWISVESVHYDTTPFTKVQHVIQALVSSATGNIAFINKKAISLRSTNSNNHITIRTENFEWECGSMAGDYLAVVGFPKENGRIESSKKQSYRLYKVSSDGVLDLPQSYHVIYPLSEMGNVIVSPGGDLLFQDKDYAQLYLNCNNSRLVPLTVTCNHPPTLRLGPPQGIYFSSDGRYAFVKTLVAKNYFRIGVWCVSNLQDFTYYDYWREKQDSTAPLTIIPFPRSPSCIIWDEYNKLWFLRRQGRADPQPTAQKAQLQAVAISPDEDSVVFITCIPGLFPKSSISVSRLLIDNDNFRLGEPSPGVRLDQSLSHHKKSAAAVQTTDDGLRVIVAHHDGTHEVKEVRT